MRVFELFSGIGGMHLAFKECGIDAVIVRALDINTTANLVYKHNFPETVLMENNVQSLSEDIFNKLEIDIISMSPPCQPFTRVGLQMGSEDNRCDALYHILKLLPNLSTVKYIIMENVVGFDTSSTRADILSTLNNCNFKYQEFIISPTQLHIPNSRSRYYLLAKKNDLHFTFKEIEGIRYEIPSVDNLSCKNLIKKYKPSEGQRFQVGEIIDESANNYLSDKILNKYAKLLDIVTSKSTNTCCFTKAYSHYVEGTGSVYCPLKKEDIDDAYLADDSNRLVQLKNLKMRFFSPTEISRLMCFPSHFQFPNNLTLKQKYRLLGNSVNVHVVAVLIRLLID